METSVIAIDPDAPEPQKVTIAGSVIREGRIVAFPTDTVYGLGVDIFNEEAVKEVYRVKRRAVDKPTSIMISEEEWLRDLVAEVSEPARALMRAFWPGALTIVFPVSKSGRISRMLTGDSRKRDCCFADKGVWCSDYVSECKRIGASQSLLREGSAQRTPRGS
jgi:L-threonylcarbamoyladenylate synthase